MTTSPSRGGSAGEALSRLKRPKLAKANERSVVEEMTAPDSPAPAFVAEPVAPVEPAVHVVPEPIAAPAAVPVAPPTPEPSPVEPEPARAVPRRKMSFAPTPDEHDRIRSAFSATRHLTRYATLNDFLRAIVLEECTRLEDEHNGGAEFDWKDAEIPKGRPLRF
ncbi:MAG: hypothetical protein ABWX89_10270 [Paeniglutamicibacter terrestris]